MSDKIHVHICYGLLFERDFEFPWREDEKLEGDWEEWWYRQQEGYPTTDEFYDEDGEYLEGVTREMVDARDEEREAWREKVGVPPPFKAIDCCTSDCERLILAVPSTVQDADWWEPIAFEPDALHVSFEETIRLGTFIKQHIPDAPPFAPRWYASAYLG